MASGAAQLGRVERPAVVELEDRRRVRAARGQGKRVDRRMVLLRRARARGECTLGQSTPISLVEQVQ